MFSPKGPQLLAAIAAVVFFGPSPVRADEPPPGAGPAVKLFDGRTLDGWTQYGGKAPFAVKDGEIVGTVIEEKANSFLATKKEYGDFVLDVDFKIDSGNSGIQFRSHIRPEGDIQRVFGYQAEIDPKEPAKIGGIYEEGARGWIHDLRKTDTGKQAAAAFKPDGWNHYRIEAVGDHIRTWLNGTPITDFHDAKTRSGFFALQVHAVEKNEGKTVHFKNITLHEISGQTGQGGKPNTLTAHEEKAGWKLLWDGETTEGWRSAHSKDFPKSGWEIKDGVLSVLPGNGGESQNGGDIITRRKYENFELVADFKITPGANSGIKYFVDPELNKGPGSAIGCEFQILDDERHPDAKLGRDGNRKLGSLYDLIPAPGDKKVNPPGEWNTARIVVQGNHVEHWLNGEKVVSYERGTPAWRALVATSKYKDWPKFGELPEGFILLQDHGNAVSFRNLKIRELPAQ